MTYQLPQFDLSYGTEDGPIHYYTAEQMQAAYQAGRDAMKAECVKAVHNCLNDYVFTAEMAGHAGRHLQMAENAIKGLK